MEGLSWGGYHNAMNTIRSNICQSDNDFNISSKSNLTHSQHHVEMVESDFDQSTKSNSLESEENDKARKSKIPIPIKCMSEEGAASQKEKYVYLTPSGSNKEQMDFIISRLERIEKALFPDIDVKE